MRILKELDKQVFKDRFTNKQDCYDFLAELKWSDVYNCKPCQGNIYIKGKQPSSRNCGYDESTTTDTLFHKLKFGLSGKKFNLGMKSSEQYPLEEEVHVDEFEIGTPQAGESG